MKIIECSRDAMQGISTFIPTAEKIDYLNALLKVGFYAIDCGSFVSPKMIPQMQDTTQVLESINRENSVSKLSVIVANLSGAQKAMAQKNVDILGYPFSLSESFQQRNTNRSRPEAVETIKEIQSLLQGSSQELLVYYSMAFGNPYNDDWNIEEIIKFTETFAKIGIRSINLSDTVGMADLPILEYLFATLIKEFPEIDFGAHLHSSYTDWKPKVQKCYEMGCTRFDGAIKGFGGCPMAKDELVGNIPTEKLITFAEENKIPSGINVLAFESAYNKALQIMS